MKDVGDLLAILICVIGLSVIISLLTVIPYTVTLFLLTLF